MDVFALSCMNPEIVNELIWQGGSQIGGSGSISRRGWLSNCGLMALCHQNIHNFFVTYNLISDVRRYTAKIKNERCDRLFWNDSTDFPCSEYFDLKPPIQSQTIVLILESPHKDEFCYNQTGIHPIAHAQGDTGKGIASKLRLKITEAMQTDRIIIDDGYYPIILSNPVAWQASLHYLYNDGTNMHGDIKNVIWRLLWKLEFIKDDYKRKLSLYSPSLIINACTGGSNTGSLNSGIQNYLNNEGYANKIMRQYHPSVW